MPVRFTVVLLVGMLTPLVSGAQVPDAARHKTLPVRSISFFPFHGRWHGGDVAYSIQLSADRFLWLFGDTFVGKPGTQRLPGDAMPRNTVGIADCAAGQMCNVKYYWTEHAAGPPSAFFDTGTDEWYWPLDGFVSGDTLYVFLEKMHTKGEGAFGFAFSGVVLASVKNFEDPPSLWKVVYRPVLSGDAVIPGVAAVAPPVAGGSPGPGTEPGFIYLFASVRNGGSPGLALMKLPAASLNDPAVGSGHWQYLAKGGQWHTWTRPDSLPTDAAILVRGNFAELTVKYHPDLRRWLMTMPGSLIAGVAVSSDANFLTGPWSPPKPIYNYPEMQKGNVDHTPNVFCYAAKEHPELESNGSFTFTYACNSTKVSEVLANSQLYHPVVVTMPMTSVVSVAKK